MFQVNDHVVYGNYGICVVKAIGSLEMDSVVKDRLYYTLEPLYTQKNTIYTPVDSEKNSLRRAITREEALELAKDTLKRAYQALDEQNLGHIHLCPETMGKVNQLGTLEEVLELCLIDERLIPCIDFGHLNARTFGKLNSFEAVKEVFDKMEDKLGTSRMRQFHSHFSKIEYTLKGGEKCHLTFADTIYGPQFEPVAEMIVRKNASPTIICESAGTQAEDALTMKQIYCRQKEQD